MLLLLLLPSITTIPRFNRTMGMLEGGTMKFECVVIAIVMEPIRKICSWFLKGALYSPCDRKQPAPRQQLAWRRASIVVHALQHVAALLTGVSGRLRLVWQFVRGYASVEEWFDACPSDAKLLRRVLLLAEGWIERRLVATMETMDVQLFMLGDRRRRGEHAGLKRKFMSFRPCCLKPGAARELRKQEGIEQKLDDPVLQLGLEEAAYVTWVSIVDLERRHARHRHIANPDMPWELFAAFSTHQEAKLQMAARHASAVAELPSLPQPPPPPVAEPPSLPQPLPPPPPDEGHGEDDEHDEQREFVRGQSALLLFRKDFLAKMRRLCGQVLVQNKFSKVLVDG